MGLFALEIQNVIVLVGEIYVNFRYGLGLLQCVANWPSWLICFIRILINSDRKDEHHVVFECESCRHHL